MPQSALGLIENPARLLDITLLKPKSISLHWEFMFTRSLYQTPDMFKQGHLLNLVAERVEAGQIKSTLHTQSRNDQRGKSEESACAGRERENGWEDRARRLLRASEGSGWESSVNRQPSTVNVRLR